VTTSQTVATFPWLHPHILDPLLTPHFSTFSVYTCDHPACRCAYLFILFCVHFSAFSALTLLVGQQEGHPARKKTEWWGAGMAICLERGADLHMAQLMPLALTVSCFNKIQIGYLTGTGSPHLAIKRVCVCLCSSYDVCSCFIIAVTVLYCAFVLHVRGHSEALCCLFQ